MQVRIGVSKYSYPYCVMNSKHIFYIILCNKDIYFVVLLYKNVTHYIIYCVITKSKKLEGH